MKILFCNQTCYRFLSVSAAAFLVGTALMTLCAVAEDKPLRQGYNNENKKIHITSDKLISDSKAMYAEFVGNVRAVQETNVLTADRLKIFYKKDFNNTKIENTGEESIEKIVANGNVTIKFDNKVAVTEKAEYITETGVFVLTGVNSKVTSGKNFIAGEKITLYRANDRITVESSGEKRVQAEFFAGEEGIAEQPGN